MLRLLSWLSAVGLLWAAATGVCLAEPAEDSAATLVKSIGRVSVLRDSEPWALEIGDRIKPKQVIVTGPDGFAVFKLSDGSEFEVYPNSRFTFRDNPGDWRDLLELMLGRVKVHVQKWYGQPNPKKVHTPTAIISVRGTIFDVAIEDGDTTLVVVEEGQVAVEHRVLRYGQPRLLNPGEWIRVYKDEPLAKSSVDKTGVIRSALRAVADALYTAAARTTRTPTGGGGAPPTGGGLPGDHGNDPPPSTGGGTTTPGDGGPGGPGSAPGGPR